MKQKPPTPRSQKKRPYSPPKLVVHGDLKTLTKVKAGAMQDGGKPETRATGAPG
jgi:hypothetical protein